MKSIASLLERIISRVNLNLSDMDFDVSPYVQGMVSTDDLVKQGAICGVSLDHALYFAFKNSALAGSYFLDKCDVRNSVVYETDVRGDELKKKGDVMQAHDQKLVLDEDEGIDIQDSFLYKALVHSFSHDPLSPEQFFIHQTVALPWSNIHGSPVAGSFLGPASTIDLTTVRSSVVGRFAYVQVGEMTHRYIPDGQIWVNADRNFEFRYQHTPEVLDKYISYQQGALPVGVIPEFLLDKQHAFDKLFADLLSGKQAKVPQGTAVSSYAALIGEVHLENNVFVSQRSYVENSFLGAGANVQEKCYIVNSSLDGNNVTAHGGKIINAEMEEKIFVGFNSFLRGSDEAHLKVDKQCIIMPHTIIDLEESVEIPTRSLVWGYITKPDDLEEMTMPLEELSRVKDEYKKGRMWFSGLGANFVQSFVDRIEHILELNGAFFDGSSASGGHAQRSQTISLNFIQSYRHGPQKGLFPELNIRP
jgi:carbonic anhydrase/acetyltransferase-like protein (isoleucine patch superfamily)